MKKFGWTNKEEVFLLTSVGNQKTKFAKRDYTPVEVGEKLTKAVNNGATNKEIASFLSVDNSLVARFLRVFNDLDKKYHHLVSFTPVPEGKISFDIAQEIARFPKKEQAKLISAILEYKFSREQIQAVFQQLERTDRKISEIIKNIAKRSGGQRRILIMGLISDELRDKIQNLKLNDLESMSNLILSKKSIKEYLKKQKIKVEKLTIGKNTFSLLVLRTSVQRKTIEEISDLILKELKNEVK